MIENSELVKIPFICKNEPTYSFKIEISSSDFNSATLETLNKKIKEHTETMKISLSNISCFYGEQLMNLSNKETIKYYSDLFPLYFNAVRNYKLLINNKPVDVIFQGLNCQVKEFKKITAQIRYLDMKIEDFYLTYNGKVLEDDKLLSEYGIVEGSIIINQTIKFSVKY
jgi:hypothetical protein